uniref:ABC transporter permease n=1 Tax=Thermorudis sp. TaxID=1969470 RepID=A0A7C2WC89_9BACT
MSGLGTMTLAFIRMTLRNRMALFWMLAFPAIFIVLFGFILGNDEGPDFEVGVVGAEQSPVSQGILEQMRQTASFTITLGTETDERQALEEGDRDAVLIFQQADNGRLSAQILYDQSDFQRSQVAMLAIQQFLERANAEMTAAQPAIEIAVEGVQSNALRFIDFLTPGILGMAIMQNGVIGMSMGLVGYRERGILRRIKATPFPLWKFLVAHVLSQLGIAVLQAIIFIGLAMTLFDLTVAGDVLSMLVMVISGCLAFISLGFIVSGMTRNVETASAVATIVTFPMMFLSGVFFPIDTAPAWMQPITKIMPLTYLVEALREIIIRGQSILTTWPNLLVMVATAVVGLAIGLRFFRWEPRAV